MKLIDITSDNQIEIFAKEAAKHFYQNPDHNSYTKENLKEDELIALRWNPFGILVFRISQDMEPRIYNPIQLIGYQLPEPEHLLCHKRFEGETLYALPKRGCEELYMQLGSHYTLTKKLRDRIEELEKQLQ